MEISKLYHGTEMLEAEDNSLGSNFVSSPAGTTNHANLIKMVLQ